MIVVVSVLVFLVLTILVAVRLPVVQTVLVREISAMLSKSLNTTVSIGSVRFEPVRKLVLRDIYIEDLRHDTILYAPVFKANISHLRFKEYRSNLSLIELNNTRISIKKYKGENELNIRFLEDFFSAPADTVAPKPWKFDVDMLKIRNADISFRDENFPDSLSQFDPMNIRLRSLNLVLNNIHFEKDSISALLRNFSFMERCGFNLEQLKAGILFTSTAAALNNLDLKTSNSMMRGNFRLEYDSLGCFSDFYKEVKILADVKETEISTNDLACFIPQLKEVNRSVSTSMTAAGTVNHLKISKWLLSYGKDTRFSGNLTVRDLPDLEEAYINLQVISLATSPADLKTLPSFPLETRGLLSLPPEVERLGAIKFDGRLSGFYNDFVAYGNLNTGLGFISSDLKFKFDKIPVYSGHFSAIDFDAGAFFNAQGILGKISLNTEIKGVHFDVKQLAAHVTGNIQHFELLGYGYKNILVNAELARMLFSGNLDVHDPNLKLNFNGTVDFAGDEPRFDFKAAMDNARIAVLNWVKADSSASLTARMEMEADGSNADNVEGVIRVKDFCYSARGKELKTASASFKSETRDNTRKVELRSEFADLFITGSYRRSSVFTALSALLRKYIPASESSVVSVEEIQDFDYDVIVKKFTPVADVFFPGLEISEGTSVSGTFSSLKNDFSLNLMSSSLGYKNFKMRNVVLNGKTSATQFDYDLRISNAAFRDSLEFRNSRFYGVTNKDSAHFFVALNGRDSIQDQVRLESRLKFEGVGRTFLNFEKAMVRVNGNTWNVNPSNQVYFDTTYSEIKNLDFTSGREAVRLNGILSRNENETLKLAFEHFDLNPLNKIFSTLDLSFNGITDGTVGISSVLQNPKFSVALSIADFSFFSDTLGTATIQAGYAPAEKKIKIGFNVMQGKTKNIAVNGTYFFHQPTDELDFSILLTKLNLAPLGHYLSGFASQVRGYIGGDFTLKGPVSKPALEGTAVLQKASLVVDYLNTRYSFSDNVEVKKNRFVFRNVVLNDSLGNQALVNGEIFHRNFTDFGISMNFNAEKILCLSTTARQNSLFYGTAFATGMMSINGLFDNISLYGSLSSERGTEISIPLASPEEITASSFISFVSNDTVKQPMQQTTSVDLSGISMKLDLDITDDALIKLIYDEKIGDKLEGRGNGNIVMEIGSDNTFVMRGEYTVTSGSYLFTLQNVINKKFTLASGGTIRWSGSPYDALIDINAVYHVRASLYDLIPDSSSTSKSRVPVNLNLSLTRQLLNPDIKFGIDIPDIDPSTQSIVRSAIPSEDEVNKQTLSLLVINRFQRGINRNSTFTQVSSSSGLEANASELLSAQLTNWISQLTDVVDVGINYRAADRLNSDQLEVMLATRLFNDRVTVETNVGFNGSNTAGVEENTSSIVGDFNVDVKLSDDGRFHFKAFNRSNNVNFLNSFNAQYTQGIGVFYRQEFNSWSDILKKKKKEPEQF